MPGEASMEEYLLHMSTYSKSASACSLTKTVSQSSVYDCWNRCYMDLQFHHAGNGWRTQKLHTAAPLMTQC
jgi:hypothetical protein